MSTHQEKKNVAGRYRIERATARTSAGVLYDATELVSQKRVALEVASALTDEEARARFLKDAMTAERLTDDHVLRVWDSGTLKDGVPFVAREPAIATLAMELRTRGHVSLEQAVAWTLETCEAVAEAHTLGMAHGNIRPENVLLARNEHGALIAKLLWETAEGGDVQTDIRALADLLRVLATGSGAEGAPTLPTPLVRAVVQAGSGELENVGALAELIAPYAPFGHSSARNISFLLARAGVATMPPRDWVDRSANARTSGEWYQESGRYETDVPILYGEPPRRGKGVAFAFVAALLVAAAGFLTLALVRAGDVRWSGTGEDTVAMTYLTAAEIHPDNGSSDVAAQETTDDIVSRSLPLALAATETTKPVRATTAATDLPDAQIMPRQEVGMPGVTRAPATTTPPAPREPAPAVPEAARPSTDESNPTSALPFTSTPSTTETAAPTNDTTPRGKTDTTRANDTTDTPASGDGTDTNRNGNGSGNPQPPSGSADELK